MAAMEWTERAFPGRGGEAARVVVDRDFERPAVPCLTAVIAPDPGNTASARVAERLGFTPGREDSFPGKPVTVHMLRHPGRRDHSEG
jgi:RimJ/RimL family protein N-acetyltransferase